MRRIVKPSTNLRYLANLSSDLETRLVLLMAMEQAKSYERRKRRELAIARGYPRRSA